MTGKTNVEKLLKDLFEEQALFLAALDEIDAIDSLLVSRLIQNFRIIRRKMLRRINESTPGTSNQKTPEEKQSLTKPHPDIQEFLKEIRSDQS